MPADTKPPDLRFATIFEKLKDCSAVVVGAFLVVRLVTPYGIGFGDVRLAAVTGQPSRAAPMGLGEWCALGSQQWQPQRYASQGNNDQARSQSSGS
jgi:hypothetical protein